MLSMVDENDLAEFVPEKKPQTETPSVVIPETEKKSEAEKPEKKQIRQKIRRVYCLQ